MWIDSKSQITSSTLSLLQLHLSLFFFHFGLNLSYSFQNFKLPAKIFIRNATCFQLIMLKGKKKNPQIPPKHPKGHSTLGRSHTFISAIVTVWVGLQYYDCPMHIHVSGIEAWSITNSHTSIIWDREIPKRNKRSAIGLMLALNSINHYLPLWETQRNESMN